MLIYKILLILVTHYLTDLNISMEPNQLKLISHFIFLKQKHSNSCIYNYTPSNLSKRFGHSKGKWEKHVRKFIKQGWCREHKSRAGGLNLVFNPLEKVLPTELQDFVANPDQWTARAIHNQLLIFILSNQEKKQKFVAQIKSDLTKPKSVVSYKRALRLSKRFNIRVKTGEKIDPRFVISVYSLGKLFNCSISYASKIMHRLQEDGHLSIIKNISKISTPKISFRYLDSPSSFFSLHGYSYKREMNEYVIGGLLSA